MLPGGGEKIGLQAVMETQQFQQGLNQYISGLKQAEGATSSAASTLSGAGGLSGGAMAAAVALGNLAASAISTAVNGLGQIVTFGVQSVATLQSLSIALETLAARDLVITGTSKDVASAMGTAEIIAGNLLEKIAQLSIVSPFEYQDIVRVTRMGIAFGISQGMAVDMTKAVTDMAAGMGLSSTHMDRMIYLLGQINRTGKVAQREVRFLGMAGIDVAHMFRDQFGKSVQEVNQALQEGAITTKEVMQGIINYSDKFFAGAAQKASRTLSGLKSSFKDVFFFASKDIFGPVLDRLTVSLGKVLDAAIRLRESGAFQWLGAILDLGAEAVGKFATGLWEGVKELVGATETAGSTVEGFGERVIAMATNAFNWGFNIIAELASGIIQAGTTVLTMAINFISGIMSYWFEPGSPPKIAKYIDKWGTDTINEWLKGFTKADFDILQGIQRPLQQALNQLAELGKISKKQAGFFFADISAAIMQALQGEGKLTADVYEMIRKRAGMYGDALVELAKRQEALFQAEEKVRLAEEAIEKARKRGEQAAIKANKLTEEYNELLRKGADKSTLESKLKEINAQRKIQQDALKEVSNAEKKRDLAKENLDTLKEQLQLQQDLVEQLLQMTKAQTFQPLVQAAEALKKAAGALKKATGGAGISPPEIDPELFKPLTKNFDLMKLRIRYGWNKLVIDMSNRWHESLDPVVATFAEKWAEFTNLPVWAVIGQKWKGIEQQATTAWAWIKQETTAGVNYLNQWWALHGDNVKVIYDKIKLEGQNLWDEVIADSTTDWNTFMTWWDGSFWPGFTATAAFGWDTIKKGAKHAMDDLGLLVDGLAAGIEGDWSVMGELLKQHTTDTWAAISSLWTTALEKLRYSQQQNRLKLMYEWNKFKIDVATVITNLKTAITNLFEQIKTAIVTKIEEAITAVKAKATEWYNIGKDIVLDMAKGIKDWAYKVIDAIVKAIKDAIKEAWDAWLGGSPSKVMIEMGEFAMKGLAIGIERQAYQPIKAAQVSSIQTAAAMSPVTHTYYSQAYAYSTTINMGGVRIGEQLSEAQFDEKVSKIIRKGMRR